MGNSIPSTDASFIFVLAGEGREAKKKQDEAILIINISEIKLWTINDRKTCTKLDKF